MDYYDTFLAIVQTLIVPHRKIPNDNEQPDWYSDYISSLTKEGWSAAWAKLEEEQASRGTPKELECKEELEKKYTSKKKANDERLHKLEEELIEYQKKVKELEEEKERIQEDQNMLDVAAEKYGSMETVGEHNPHG